MHEFGMCEGVVAAVERRADGRPVARVRVRAGAALRLVPEVFQQAFTVVAAGGPAGDAVTELVTEPVRGVCRDCGAAFASTDPLPACAGCGSVALRRENGDELILESIEYRTPRTTGAGG